MGGLISLEMSQIFADFPNINVVGTVMIESVYPGLLNRQQITVEAQDLCLTGKMSLMDQKRAANLIFDATQVAKSYLSTSWEGSAVPPAPLMLVKARDPVPSRKDTPVPEMLGWDELGDQWITTMYEVPGHHFSIFQEQNVREPTLNMRFLQDRLIKSETN